MNLRSETEPRPGFWVRAGADALSSSTAEFDVILPESPYMKACMLKFENKAVVKRLNGKAAPMAR